MKPSNKTFKTGDCSSYGNIITLLKKNIFRPELLTSAVAFIDHSINIDEFCGDVTVCKQCFSIPYLINIRFYEAI